ncbi:hypothetical protein [Nocardia fluminea]|uniref:hypothetical protein n=1 Tax=Nocardia fluminea TaxID=134984 RepID=UPI0036581F61
MTEHDAVNTANALAARAAGWPDLTGSPKQIPWANTVRMDLIGAMETSDMTDHDRDRYRSVMLRETAAHAWIDSRNLSWHARFIGSLTPEELEALLAEGARKAAEAAESGHGQQ